MLKINVALQRALTWGTANNLRNVTQQGRRYSKTKQQIIRWATNGFENVSTKSIEHYTTLLSFRAVVLRGVIPSHDPCYNLPCCHKSPSTESCAWFRPDAYGPAGGENWSFILMPTMGGGC